MRTVNVPLGERSYAIHIGSGALSHGEALRSLAFRQAVVVTNIVVAPLYLDRVLECLARSGISTSSVILPDGEETKNWQTLNHIFDQLLSRRAERSTALVALGGGVIGDLVGFAAATYQRGVPFIQVPTTLLSQVDSSVGGKTGINHPLGKNMVGAFYQPKLVLADTDTLATLPRRELSAGLAEVIKYGLIRDLAFFEWLEQNIERLLALDSDALAIAVERSCAAKAEVVAADEFESGVRALLNLGHTFGHAIESGVGYGNWLHGEAVAAGTVMAAEVSRRLGWLTDQECERIRQLYRRAGLPTVGPQLHVDRYLELMSHDKKVQGGRIRYVLLDGIGAAKLSDQAPEAEVRAAISACSPGA